MTALIRGRQRAQAKWKKKVFTLSVGHKAFKHGRAALDLATLEVVPAESSPGLLSLGSFLDEVDATSVAKPVGVEFDKELTLEWFANATSTDAVTANDVGKLCFFLDDQTVTITPSGRSKAGRVWAVDSAKGVLVEVGMEMAPVLLEQPDVASYTANDWAPAAVTSGAVYDVPTTGAASTITLPAAAQDGTIVHFAADGTKNGHTVQYRDATGPANLTTALTASKRHLVTCIKRDGKWVANAYVSP